MAIGCHCHAKLLADDLLVVEAQPLGKTAQLRLVGCLLKQDEDQEGKQREREAEPDDSADVGNALKQGDQNRRSDRVERELLPLGKTRWHGLEISAMGGATKGRPIP